MRVGAMFARLCVRFLLLAALPTLTGRWWGADCEVVSVLEPRSLSGAGSSGSTPALVGDQDTSVTVARGQTAALDCQVLRLGDNTVSWIRTRDLQILSYAGVVFTADARVSASVRRQARISHHTLTIRELTPEDSGRYECQVNTEPKLSLFFNLTVVDEEMPSLIVRAVEEDVWGTLGGSATLACEARYEPEPRALHPPPPSLTWYHAGDDGEAVPLAAGASTRPLAVDTQRWAARALSRLTLLQLGYEDAGQYVCTAGQPPVQHVVNLRIRAKDEIVEPFEAMQRDQSAANRAIQRYSALSLLILTTINLLI